jgi:hypothetical protein
LKGLMIAVTNFIYVLLEQDHPCFYCAANVSKIHSLGYA